MKFNDYLENNEEWARVGEALVPVSENAKKSLERLEEGEITNKKDNNKRDVKFHKCYFAFLKFIYGYLPKSFKNVILDVRIFYKFIKIMQNEFDLIHKFKNGITLIELRSISFSRMDENKFREFIKNQIPIIYGEILPEYFEGEILKNIIETIEEDFEKFFGKLFKTN